MFPYLIAGAIGFAVAKIFESDEAPKYADGGETRPFTDDGNKFVVFNQYRNYIPYKIAVDNVNDVNYITLWKTDTDTGKDKKIGYLRLYESSDGFLSVSESSIDDRGSKGLGLGLEMYKTALKYSSDKIKGIKSYLPNRTNKKQIPKIYKKLNSVKDGDYEYILKERNPNIRFDDGGETTTYVSDDFQIGYDGAYEHLIAPNGKPSNLTPEQYKLVRTPEFKAWFGDWENDPTNASKVIDSNGEPLVVYHGTPDARFSVFDKNKFHTRSKSPNSKGFFFTPSKDYARAYSESSNNKWREKAKEVLGYYPVTIEARPYAKEIPCFLNIKNPKYSEDSLLHTIKSIKINDGLIVYFWKEELKDLNENKIFEIAVFEPNQIKLADGSNTTFDSNNPDIRFDEGGEVLGSELILRNKGLSRSEDGSAFISKNDVFKKITIPVSQINNKAEYSWYKRKGLDEDISIIDGLINKIKSGIKLNPIILDSDFKILDGNHRLVAYKKLKIKEIEVYIKRENNPDIRYAGGGELKKTYQDLIEGYELSLEIESDEEKIKMYGDLIDGYKLALELEDEEINEVEQIKEVMNEEVVQDDFKPSYLMTLDEYRAEVTPLIQAYKKFLRKNKDWFIKPDYYGLAHYSLEEALELKDSSNAVFSTNTYYGEKKSNEEAVRYNYSYQKTRKFIDNYTQEPTPPNLITENKEYIQKLKKYFSINDLNYNIEDDEIKSNKRSVRRAIDKNIYRKLLTDKKLELSRLEMISESVGLRLPKSIFDKSTQNQMKYEAELGKLLANIPTVSFDKLKELIEQIKVDLIPLEQEVYDKEYKRYTALLKKYVGETLLAEKLNPIIPIWILLYNSESEYKKELTTDFRGRERMESVRYEKINSLKSDWENQLSIWLKEQVDSLKDSIILAIMTNFYSINMPIESVERLKINVGYKGFEGSYKFTFENGSSFVMNFQGIGAGGYNIQRYHFRFLTNFSNVILADGSIGGTNSYQIVNNFSFKK